MNKMLEKDLNDDLKCNSNTLLKKYIDFKQEICNEIFNLIKISNEKYINIHKAFFNGVMTKSEAEEGMRSSDELLVHYIFNYKNSVYIGHSDIKFWLQDEEIEESPLVDESLDIIFHLYDILQKLLNINKIDKDYKISTNND